MQAKFNAWAIYSGNHLMTNTIRCTRAAAIRAFEIDLDDKWIWIKRQYPKVSIQKVLVTPTNLLADGDD